jgi:hypothetical protein
MQQQQQQQQAHPGFRSGNPMGGGGRSVNSEMHGVQGMHRPMHATASKGSCCMYGYSKIVAKHTWPLWDAPRAQHSTANVCMPGSAGCAPASHTAVPPPQLSLPCRTPTVAFWSSS